MVNWKRLFSSYTSYFFGIDEQRLKKIVFDRLKYQVMLCSSVNVRLQECNRKRGVNFCGHPFWPYLEMNSRNSTLDGSSAEEKKQTRGVLFSLTTVYGLHAQNDTIICILYSHWWLSVQTLMSATYCDLLSPRHDRLPLQRWSAKHPESSDGHLHHLPVTGSWNTQSPSLPSSSDQSTGKTEEESISKDIIHFYRLYIWSSQLHSFLQKYPCLVLLKSDIPLQL